MSDKLMDIQEAFPGIWVREDGALLLEHPFVMRWSPGDVESDLVHDPARFTVEGVDGRLFLAGDDFGRGPVRLKLSQIQALADYITATDSAASAKRIREEDGATPPPHPANAGGEEGGERPQLPDGFTAWTWSEAAPNPDLDPNARVEVYTQRGGRYENVAGDLCWEPTVELYRKGLIDLDEGEPDKDIIGYRPIPPQPADQAEAGRGEESEALQQYGSGSAVSPPDDGSIYVRNGGADELPKGFILHGRKGCPVSGGEEVEILWRKHDTAYQRVVIDSFWSDDSAWEEVFAYRPLPTPEAEGNTPAQPEGTAQRIEPPIDVSAEGALQGKVKCDA